MKIKNMLLMLAAIAAGAIHMTSMAAEAAKAPAAAAKAEAPEWAELFGDASLPVVWQSSQAAAQKIAAAVSAKTFEGIPDWAETIHLAAHALGDQVKLEDAEAQKRFKSALGQAAKLADDVLDAAHHNETQKLADAFRRMNAALQVAASRLPKEIVDAPKQEVRFAKAAAHSHGESAHPH